MSSRPLDLASSALAEAASTPSTLLTLQKLLDTRQAIAILPGLLYFASTGECLSSPAVDAAATPVESISRTSDESDAPVAAAALATSQAMEAVRDFYFKENPFVSSAEKDRHEQADKSALPTARAAVGQDAVFVSLREVPPYLYRPFFADFGPLDMGCCVHFARRLCELLLAVTGVDVCASPTSDVVAGGPLRNAKSSETATPALRTQPGEAKQDNPALSCSVDPASTVSSSSYTSSTQGTARPVVVCASLNAQERVNTACLVGAFCVLCLGWTAAATWYHGFVNIYPGFLSYRDASQGVSNYPLSLIDVWAGLEQGVALGLVNISTFDLPAFLEGRREDYSWVVPRRFIAMSSPQDSHSARTAEIFARRLRPLGVRLVVRLNDNLYSPSPLLRLGIQHVDLPYADGSVPSDSVLLRFLQVVEEHFGEAVQPVSLREWWTVSSVSSIPSNTKTASRPATCRSKKGTLSAAGASQQGPVLQPCSVMHSGTCRGMPEAWTAVPPLAQPTPDQRPGSAQTNRSQSRNKYGLALGDKGAVAVHCLAGLGRTGTMLAVYMMRHYGFTARAVIGWLRLCRPGSITGIQQQYLDAMERRLRPPPHMLAALHLNASIQRQAAVGEKVQSRHLTGSPRSLMSFLLDPAAAARATGGEERALDVSRDPGKTPLKPPVGEGARNRGRSFTAVAAFQTHGSIVADARPAITTSVVDSPTKQKSGHRASTLASRTTLEPRSELGIFEDMAGWSGVNCDTAADLAREREAQQQQHSRVTCSLSSSSSSTGHNSSDSVTLSLDTIRPDGAVFGVVARMPSLGHGNVNTPPLKKDSTAAGASDHDGALVHRSPHVSDYKYASTYFVAMEQASGPPRTHPWSLHAHTAPVAKGEPGAAQGGGRLRVSTAKAFRSTPPRGQRPQTATTAASTSTRSSQKVQGQKHLCTRVVKKNNADAHASGNTPLARAEFSDTQVGDTDAVCRYNSATLRTPRPPSALMRSYQSCNDGSVAGQANRSTSPLVQNNFPPVIPASSLPMWGRPIFNM